MVPPLVGGFRPRFASNRGKAICSCKGKIRILFWLFSHQHGIELLLQEQVCTPEPHGHLQNCTTEHILKTINLSLRDRTFFLQRFTAQGLQLSSICWCWAVGWGGGEHLLRVNPAMFLRG